MKLRLPSLRPSRRQRGSTLMAVVFFAAIMALLTGSILKFTGNERRGNERNHLILRARNMAENVALYASEQITTKLYRLRTVSQMEFTGSKAIALPPSSVLTTAYSGTGDVEVHAGITENTALTLITDTSSANYGLQVQTGTIPVIAKSTMRHPALGSVTAYAEQRLQINLVPLFQFAIFYDKDLEISPGADMVIAGPVHSNGNLIARSQTGFNNVIQFLNRVTAVGGFFANTGYKGTIYNETGSADSGPGGDGALRFQNPSGTVTAIKSSGGVWRDHRYGGTNVTTTSLNNFKTFATSSYAGHFRTSVHGVTSLELPGVDSTDDNRGRNVIEPPDTADSAGLRSTKFSRNAGLYIIVNPDDDQRNGILPDGSSVAMRARSYRAWLNSVNNDGTHTIQEVILPGQPSYGALNANVNNLPNAYRVDTAIGHNQVLRIPKGGGVDRAGTGYGGTGFAAPSLPTFPALPDAYFYDLRRATNSNGYPFNRPSLTFRPRPIAKVDFDLIRFEAMIERTLNSATSASLYNPARPNSDNWNSNILNASASPATTGLGLSPAGITTFNVVPTYDTVFSVQQSQNAAHDPSTLVIRTFSQTGATGTIDSLSSKISVAYTRSPAFSSATWVETFPTSAATTLTYSPPRGSTFIRIRAYLDSATAHDATRLFDEQIIPITPDIAPLGVLATDENSDGNPDSSRFIIAETTDTAFATTTSWTDRYTSTANETSTTFTPTSASITAIRVRQYAAGGTTTLIREQVIPVIIATLSNDYSNVPSQSSGGSPIFTSNSSTEMRVFVGGVDDTANWTFSASASSGITGSLGTGAFANRYTVTGMTSTSTSTVTLTASRTGYTSQQKTFTLEKQSNKTNLGTNQTGRWLHVGCQPSPDPFRLYFAPSNPNDANVLSNPAVYAVGASDTSTPWFDGLTVYVQSVDAENLTMSSGNRVRTDSGVRLWNGRGSVVSLTATGKTGFSFATNDAAYIVGHYNADGSINSNSSSTTNPGGYSARYPESSSEKLCSIMADAITILSQPVFTSSSGSYSQSSGWSDSLSAHRVRTDNWSSNWQTTNPGNSNAVDGINTSTTPAFLPNLGTASAGSGSGRDTKFSPTVTEVSACLLTGIVPTTSAQHSGGVHNYPRLLEQWAGTGLYIRGSMVALFASEVATEPWSIRIYSGAGRYWGLHNSLADTAHDVPLEPILLNAQRLRYTELSKSEYDTTKGAIIALP